MKYKISMAKSILLLLGLLTSLACGVSGEALRATLEAEVWQTAEVEKETAVAATLSATEMVALVSFHGRYVTAMGEDDDWALRQEEELSPCGWFIQRRLEDDKITLETCHGRYVTAPITGTTTWDWMLEQGLEPGGCGRFVVHGVGSDGVALETCAERFVTAGDGNWPGDLAWSLVGETDQIQDWECFTLLQP